MLNWFKKKPDNLIVTEITSADLPWVADIHAESFSKAWSDGTFREMLSGKGMVGLLARNSAQAKPSKKSDIIGFVVYRCVADEAEIITIATTKSSRRSGVGQALLDEMIRRCISDRLTSIFLEVDETNKAAMSLYRQYGFKQAGMRKAYYAQPADSGADTEAEGNPLANKAVPAHDAIIMRLSIGE